MPFLESTRQPADGAWRRLAWASGFAVAVHLGLLVAAMAWGGAPAPAPQQPGPVELVFLTAPPPPRPSGGAAPSAARAVSRQQRPRKRTVRRTPQQLPARVQVKAPPLEPVGAEALEEAPAQAVAAAPAGMGEASEGVAGGVLGGVVGGIVGGVLGAAPVEVLDVGRLDVPPDVLESARPVYPSEARRRRVQGRVLVRIVVGVDGRVERGQTRVLESIPELDAAALEAVHRWRFSPTVMPDGRPVRVRIVIPIEFSLR